MQLCSRTLGTRAVVHNTTGRECATTAAQPARTLHPTSRWPPAADVGWVSPSAVMWGSSGVQVHGWGGRGLEGGGGAIRLLLGALALHRRLGLWVDLYLGLGEAGGQLCILEVLDADRVDSVPLIGVGVVLAVKDVSQVRVARVADDLETAKVGADAHVAFAVGVEAFVKCVPTAVFEFGRGRVERILACAAAKVALLGKEAEVLAPAWRFSPTVAQHVELLGG